MAHSSVHSVWKMAGIVFIIWTQNCRYTKILFPPETLESKMHIFFQNCDTLDFKDCFFEKLYLTCVATDNKRIYQQTISQNWAVSFIIFWNIWKFSQVCMYTRARTHSESMEELLIQSPRIFCSSWHLNFLCIYQPLLFLLEPLFLLFPHFCHGKSFVRTLYYVY